MVQMLDVELYSCSLYQDQRRRNSLFSILQSYYLKIISSSSSLSGQGCANGSVLLTLCPEVAFVMRFASWCNRLTSCSKALISPLRWLCRFRRFYTKNILQLNQTPNS